MLILPIWFFLDFILEEDSFCWLGCGYAEIDKKWSVGWMFRQMDVRIPISISVDGVG